MAQLAHAVAQAPTLLDALARAPAAAALVVAALEEKADRKALRLAHPQLRDAVSEATTKLEVGSAWGPPPPLGPARPPTPRRWPRLEELTLFGPDLAALEALGAETWAALRSLHVVYQQHQKEAAMAAPRAAAVAAALRRTPALRALNLQNIPLPPAAAEELFRSGPAPQLRALTLLAANLAPTAARALAASGWRLEELDLTANRGLRGPGLASLLAAPTFALRRLNVRYCGLGATALLALADAPWPLEELDLSQNDFRSAAAGPALAALSRHARLRRLDLGFCKLREDGFKALVEATWPALTYLGAWLAKVEFEGPHALGAAAFAGFPALEELALTHVSLGEAGAALLASRSWPGLRKLDLDYAQLGAAGLAALARGEWPALEVLDLRSNILGAPVALEDARRWAPALVELQQ